MTSGNEIFLLGVSFRTAPVAVRESLTFNRPEAIALLRQAACELPGISASVLSTCNRTEFYLAGPRDQRVVENWLALLRRFRPGARILHSDCHRYQETGISVARHLFRVASGLESSILGDSQILGQVKQAVSIAGASGTLGAGLHQLFIEAIRAGKQTRRETSIGLGAASLGSAIASLIEERDPVRRVMILPDGQEGCVSLRYQGEAVPVRILILGAGEIARDIGRHVAKRGARELIFLNRTFERAERIAEHCGGRAAAWGELDKMLDWADWVIAATGSPVPVLSQSLLAKSQARRADRPLRVIDAGVPRNVEPGAAVQVMDIDAVRERQQSVIAARSAAVPQVEAIVQNALQRWHCWLEFRPVEAGLKTLYAEVETISAETFGGFIGFGPEEQTQAACGLRRLLRRSLKDYAKFLRDGGGERRAGENSHP